jgi:hypothetical protein
MIIIELFIVLLRSLYKPSFLRSSCGSYIYTYYTCTRETATIIQVVTMATRSTSRIRAMISTRLLFGMAAALLCGSTLYSSSSSSCSAFTTLRLPTILRPTSSTSTTTSSLIVLLAKSKKNRKSSSSSSKPKSRTGGGGGAGFGAVATKTIPPVASRSTSTTKENKRQEKILDIPLSAADIAKLNTLTSTVITRQQEEQEADDEVNKEEKDEATDKPLVGARKKRRQKWSQRSESVEQTIETTQLMELYAQEHQQHQQQQQENQDESKNSNKHQGRLVKVSTNPLILTIDGFIDPEACRRVQNNADGCFDLSFPERLADSVFDGQESELDGLLFNTANSREHDANPAPHYPDGLHMDTNNQCLFRHVTCILYLNDITEECGGATVFPLARTMPEDPALAAARRLLDQKLSHTRSRSCTTLGLEEEAQLIETRVGADDTAIRIQPRAGRLLIFFSRDEKGQEDPRTWHAGERIKAQADGTMTEKRILTLFKEVDYEKIPEPSQAASTFEDFLAPWSKHSESGYRPKLSYRVLFCSSVAVNKVKSKIHSPMFPPVIKNLRSVRVPRVSYCGVSVVS